MFRRWRDRVEVSWGQRRLAGQPDRFRFLADDGFARLPVVYVANPIYSVMREAVDYLISQEPKSEQFTKLQEGLESLKKNRKELRLALLAGLGRTTAEQEQRWKKVTSQLASNPNAEKAVITVSEPAQLFLEGSCQAALMFGTTAPTIDEDDAMALAGKLIDLYAPGSESPELQDLVREELISDRSKRPWALGYDLAQEILEELSLPGGRDESVDIEKVYDSLGIFIDDLPLKDIDIRAVSIAGPDHRPSTILNPNNSKYLGNAGRRFTLAHELCHILFDRSEGARLAIASGPWAPSDLEARANAFAAMFLMPTELIRRLLPGLSTPLYTVAGVAELSAKMQTSFRATLEHLVNLGFLTPEQHDRIEIEFEAVV
jgi:Zn-dependent peptidase ImmA (M78 family)